MKNFAKTVIIAVAAALALTGCAEKKETSLAEENSSSTVSTTSASSTTSSSSSSSTTSSSKPASTATSSTSTATTSTTTTTTTTTSSSTSAAASSPVSSSTTSSVKSSSSSKSSSVKPAETVKTHDCKKDGHVWGKSYTKTETTSTTIEEWHDVAGNGYDYTLARRYFGRTETDVNWSNLFGPGHNWGESSTRVKTTATKTVTKYFHDCAECGNSEQYDISETTDPGTNWEFVNPTTRSYFTTVWYDINNIPQSVRNAVAQDDADLDDWLANLAAGT